MTCRIGHPTRPLLVPSQIHPALTAANRGGANKRELEMVSKLSSKAAVRRIIYPRDKTADRS